MADSEPLTKKKEKKDDSNDFVHVLVDMLKNLNWKLIIAIMLIFIFISSDIFVENVLSRFSDTIEDMGTPTNKGIIIQSIFMVLGYMTIDLLIQANII